MAPRSKSPHGRSDDFDTAANALMAAAIVVTRAPSFAPAASFSSSEEVGVGGAGFFAVIFAAEGDPLRDIDVVSSHVVRGKRGRAVVVDKRASR